MNKLLPALIAMALVAVPATVTAQDASVNEEIETSDDEVEISYERSVGDLDSALTIGFGTQDTTYEVSANATGDDTEFNKEMETQLHQIVEYEDDNDNGKYDEGERVVSGYMLSEGSNEFATGPANGQVEWEDLETSDATADDGTPGQRIIARGELQPQEQTEELPDELTSVAPNQTQNGTVGIDIYVYGAGAVHNDTQLDPTEIKMDFTVKDYPYVENGTQLALIQQTETTSEDQKAQPEEDDGVKGTHEVRDVRVGLLYAWDDQAEVNGTDEPVRTTVLENQTEQKDNGSDGDNEYTVERAHALSYMRGDMIVHDPRTGVVLEPTSAEGTLDKTAQEIPGTTVLGAIAAVGTALAVAGRRR